MKYLFLVIVLLSNASSAFCNPQYKGLYVDGLSKILGDTRAEDSLLLYASQNAYNALSLYEVDKLHRRYDITKKASSQLLASFIKKAREQYHIPHIAAIGESHSFFASIISKYNKDQPTVSQFDIYNFEFEFWNAETDANYCETYLQPGGYSCDISGGFDFYLDELRKLNRLAKKDGCVCETYVGTFDSMQAIKLLPYVDRVLISAYITNVNKTYTYLRKKLGYFPYTDKKEIAIIFESGPHHLGPWLKKHRENLVFETFFTEYQKHTTGKLNIPIIGYQWFTYSTMPKK